jgi:hypothetical protein
VAVAAGEPPAGQFDPALKLPDVGVVAGDRLLAWVDDLLTKLASSQVATL